MTDNLRNDVSVHELRVTLRDVRPAVWRRLAVPSSITLGELHQVLQVAFDWSDAHLHDFEARGTRYLPARPDLYGPVYFGEPPKDEDAALLGRVAPKPGDVLDYTYDFGDNWQHRLEVEAVGPARAQDQYPGCTAGAGTAPEEDTGRVRPGRFGPADLNAINNGLRALGALPGGDLAATDLVVDRHFTGLFPELAQDEQCPCGCGATPVDSGQPVLPMLRPAPQDGLALAAAGSPLVRRAIALATWVGDGRSLTPSRLLRPVDAVGAVEELGLAEPLFPPGAAACVTAADAPSGSGPGVGGRRVRSAKDLPSLHPLWTACLAGGLIEVRGGKAYPGPGLAIWQAAVDPAAQVEGWCALLAGYLRARDDAARAGRDRLCRIREQLLHLGIPLLYAMAHETVPIGALSLAFTDLDQVTRLYGSPAFGLPVMVEEMGRAMEDWRVAGVVEPADLPGDGADEFADRVVGLQAELEGHLSAAALAPDLPPDRLLQMRSALQTVVSALVDGSAVRLTALGAFGLARILTAHGWQVPRAGACVDVEPGELLDRLATYQATDAADETRAWLAVRGEDWTRAVEQVLWSASVKDEAGPLRRRVLSTVLVAAGPRVLPVLTPALADPWLAAVLSVVRFQLGGGPEPTAGQLLWLAVDALVASLDDPELFTEEVRDSPVQELLSRPTAIADAEGLDHPAAREVLLAVAVHLDDPRLSRALRKALAGRTGNPALGSVPRRRQR